MIDLSIAIQHHPSRPDLPGRLLDELGYPEDHMSDEHCEVVWDPDRDGPRSPWRTAQLAWRLTPDSCTHRLVIQDDALPCAYFREKIHAAITANPAVPLVLFFGVGSYPLGIHAYIDSCTQGDALYPLPHVGWVPCVALVMPREMALDLGSFYLPHHDRPSVADDEVVMEWAHSRGITCYATCPSLVDHDDSAESLMGTDPTRIRRAVVFADELDRAIW